MGNRTVADLVDYLTEGREREFQSSNPAEWKRLRDLIEDRLQGLQDTFNTERPQGPQVGKAIGLGNMPGQDTHVEAEIPATEMPNNPST